MDIKDDRAGEFTLLTVVAMDRPGLVSDIAGVLHAINIDIHAAQIFTRSSTDEIAIDTLYIDSEGRQLSEMKKWQLEGDLVNVLTGQLSVEDLLKRRGKAKPPKLDKVSVRVLENLSDQETVLEARSIDSPGLLHYFTKKIAELHWNIHSARVATWGHEARDVFYVTNHAGAKLDPTEVDQLYAGLGLER